MKYESDNVRISDKEEMTDEIDEQMSRLQDKLFDVMESEPVSLQVALSMFATFYVKTAKELMGMPKEVALEAIAGVIEMSYGEDEREEVKWLN